MKTIFKYPLETASRQRVPMPLGAKPLSVQMQGDQLCLWAEVDTGNPTVAYVVAVHGTGNILPDDHGRYLGTVVADPFVWHVFVEEYVYLD